VKASIIFTVLNSHEIVRRQLLHLEKLDLTDVEVILIDDGSDPPLEVNTTIPLVFHRTNDFRPWTWPVARNTGARLAKGEYLIMTDIDHIISQDFIDKVRNFTGDHIRINREFAVLDENGNLTQDREVLKSYGLPDHYKIKFTPHRNQFAIHRDLYNRLGGYREDRIGKPYPQREDGDFNKEWRKLYEKGEIRDFDDLVGYEHRPTLYMFPNGKWCGDVDYNPFGLFHNLSRK
jgi:glycosyltransferase involved in cell wall biosynthesis